MKRMNRARKNVALSIVTLGTVLATGTTAFAAEPVASVDVSDGSSEPTATNVDNAGVVDALVGLATTSVGLLNGEATPQVDGNESGGVNIVLDPGSVPGLKEAFAPQEITPDSPRSAARTPRAIPWSFLPPARLLLASASAGARCTTAST